MSLRCSAVGLFLVLLVVMAAAVHAGDALSVNGVTVSAAEVALARY